VPKSYHCRGKAADLSCSFVSLARLTVACVEAGFNGVLVYSKYNFCHCDLRPGREFLMPSDWVLWMAEIFPYYKAAFHPWDCVKNIGTVEL
jgi:hypothetical protein